MVQTQLLEVTREVATYDFPERWTSLMPEALATLSGGNPQLMLGSLLVLRKVASQLEFAGGDRTHLRQVRASLAIADLLNFHIVQLWLRGSHDQCSISAA